MLLLGHSCLDHLFGIFFLISMVITHAKHYPRRKWREGGRNVKMNWHTRLKLATDDLRDVHEMRKTCEMRETCERKKWCSRDNVKINYTHFAILLFFRTIILSLIARKNPFVSYIIPASTTRRCETWEICLVEQHKNYEITRTYTCHVSHVFRVSQSICSWLEITKNTLKTIYFWQYCPM